MTNQLSILNSSIRQLDNLYSLTDLHKVSGNEAKHKPVLFLSNQQTKDLISEIENDKVGNSTLAVKTVRGGKNPSTYACKELVIAYAAWISPQFHLVVLRAFLEKLNNTGTISPEQQQAIQSAVQQAHHRTGLHWQEIYRQIKAIFHVAKYDQLPADQFGNVMAFISNLQKVEQIKPLAPPPKKYTFDFTEDELQSLTWSWFAFVRGIHTFRYIYPMFQKLGSNIAPEIYGQGFEYSHTAQSAHKILERITKDFECDPMTNWRVLKHVRGFDPAFKKATF